MINIAHFIFAKFKISTVACTNIPNGLNFLKPKNGTLTHHCFGYVYIDACTKMQGNNTVAKGRGGGSTNY